jgi:Ras homolog gene family, member A
VSEIYRSKAQSKDVNPTLKIPNTSEMAATTVILGDPTADAIHFEEYSKDNFVDFDSRLTASSEAPRPLLDPRTRKKLDVPGRPQGLTDLDMKAIEQSAIGRVLPFLESTTIYKSKAKIEAAMKNAKGSFGFSNVGGSTVTPEQLLLKTSKFRKLKFVILGDGAAGKTYAVMKFIRGHTKDIPYVATIRAEYLSDIQVDGYHCQISWEDTTGQEDYDSLRPLQYPHCDVALLVFAIDSPDSLCNIQEKWVSEIFHFLPDIPKILVGTKSDLRSNIRTIDELAKTSQTPVTRQQGEAVARNIGKVFNTHLKYMECSSYTGDGIQELFEEATRAGIEHTSRKKKKKRSSSHFRRSREGCIAPIPGVALGIRTSCYPYR